MKKSFQTFNNNSNNKFVSTMLEERVKLSFYPLNRKYYKFRFHGGVTRERTATKCKKKNHWAVN